MRRRTVVIADQIIRRASRFIKLGNDIGYDEDYNIIDVKLLKFQTICGAVNRIFRNNIDERQKQNFTNYSCPWTAVLRESLTAFN